MKFFPISPQEHPQVLEERGQPPRTHTTLLHANGEDVKAVQELLRQGSARITMDVYDQAMTAKHQRTASGTGDTWNCSITSRACGPSCPYGDCSAAAWKAPLKGG